MAQSARAAANINPSDTTDVIGEYCEGELAEVAAAAAAARASPPACAGTTPQTRADTLEVVGAEILARHAELANLCGVMP